MPKWITASRIRVFYVVLGVLVLVLLALGEFLFHLPSRVLSLGIGLVSLTNLVALVVITRSNGSRYG